MMWTRTRYDLVRDFFANKISTTLSGMNVMKTPHYFASAQDFAKQFGETYSETYKVKYAMLDFANFRDDATKGCDDDPNNYQTFRIQLFRSIQQAKTGQDNSHELLVYDLIDLRNAFLIDRDIVGDSISHSALVQIGDIVRVQNSEHIVNELGSWINLRVTTEVNNG